ncbi:hypothetical protein [Saccharopolyspora sp. NPDC002376]
MPWFPVDDGFAFHRKAVRAGNAAIGLWTRAGSWCAQQLTDGFVPEDMVTVLGTTPQAEKLVRAGLWVRAEGGYQFHQWTENGRNPTREEVLLRRKKDAEKKARARAAKAAKSEAHQVNEDCPQGTPEGRTEGLPEGVGSTPPLPSTPQEKKTSSSSGPRKRATRIPEDFTVTAEMVTWARENCPNVDGRRETEMFVNHWTAKSGKDATKHDWERTWRNWLLRSQKDAERRAPARTGQTTKADRIDALDAFLVPDEPHLRALPGGAA